MAKKKDEVEVIDEWESFNPNARTVSPRVRLSATASKHLTINESAAEAMGVYVGLPVRVLFSKKTLRLKLVPCEAGDKGSTCLRKKGKTNPSLYVGLKSLFEAQKLTVTETCTVCWDEVGDGIVLSLPVEYVVAA